MTTDAPSSPTEPVRARRRRRGPVGFLLVLAVAVVPAASAAELPIAITVDDLPSHGPLPPGDSRAAIAARMIAVFRQHRVPGVYGFLNGAQLRDNPDLGAVVHDWRRAGFPLGNHTFSHLDLARVTTAEFLADVQRNEPVLARWSSGTSWKYFRFPYLHEGDTTEKRDAVRSALHRWGYRQAPVTVSFDDSLWNDAYGRCLVRGEQTSLPRLEAAYLEVAHARLMGAHHLAERLFRRPIRHVLLLHVGAFTALMLDALLRVYREAGASFITLPAALGDPVYRLDPRLPDDGVQTFLERFAPATRPPRSAALDEVAALCP